MPRTGRVLVLCGPSGVGKTTIAAAIGMVRAGIFVSVSATTRPPRPGERTGGQYVFLTREQFDEAEQRGEFLETATVFGQHRYGTPRAPVEAAIAEGRDVLLEIDVQGARMVKQSLPEAITIFILPPSWEVLERRLRGRGTEDPDAVARRLLTAKDELALASQFDHRVVNEDLESTIAEVDRILDALPDTKGSDDRASY